MPVGITRSLVVGTMSFLLLPVGADEPTVPAITESEQLVIAGIEEAEVLATVSFLASDELAGRNTPSVELDIASAYVAARFRGAGLEGLGPDGSFYQTTELPQFGLPDGVAELTIDSQVVKTRGVLFAGEAKAEIIAKLTAKSDAESAVGRIVVVDELPLPPQAVDQPAMLLATWSRRLQPLAAAQVAAVLVPISDDSILPAAIQKLGEKPLNLPARFQLPFPVVLVPADCKTEGEAKLIAPARKSVATPVRNVIAVLRGSDPELSKQAVILSAHLDHIGRIAGDRQGDLINNGADDNASGVTGVLMLADACAMREPRPKRSIIFMTFWGEEQGLLGSKYFADHPLWPLDDIVANINLEMIGRPEAGADGKAWATGWGHSTFGSQFARGAERADVSVFEHPQYSEMLYGRSDNFSLVRKGVIAHSISAGSLHDDYHQPGDEVSKLNIPHMTKVIRGLYAGTMPIADGVLTPEKR